MSFARRRLLSPLLVTTTLLLASASTTSLVACKAFETNVQDTEIDERDTARQNYESGEAAFAASRFQEAVKYFELVKNKFPYSKYAVLSELRLADTHFEREKWLEAADAYRIFVRYHPRHEQVAYATFRIAESHGRAVDNNVAWLPFVDARQKDQAAAKDTIRACDEFLARFPGDKNAEAARKLRAEARGRLADVDLYAASFYEKRGRWQGAQWRYARVGTEFADTAGAAKALWKAGSIASEHLADVAAARMAWERLLKDHPDAPEAKDARAALARLTGPASTPGAPPPPARTDPGTAAGPPRASTTTETGSDPADGGDGAGNSDDDAVGEGVLDDGSDIDGADDSVDADAAAAPPAIP
jgi:outer membrane protein assembly factor BamD